MGQVGKETGIKERGWQEKSQSEFPTSSTELERTWLNLAKYI